MNFTSFFIGMIVCALIMGAGSILFGSLWYRDRMTKARLMLYALAMTAFATLWSGGIGLMFEEPFNNEILIMTGLITFVAAVGIMEGMFYQKKP